MAVAGAVPDTLAGELRRLVRTAQSEKRVPSVSAAVARAGEVVWTDAVGLADVAEAREATPDTQYRIGSITKTFTAAAVMRLRDDGALELDDPLGKHLPDTPLAGPTLRRLLAHAAGIQREVPGDYWESLALPSRDEMLATLAEAEEVLTPGAHWHYSNLAFVLLGEVVGAVSGTSYEHFVEETFFGPLGLDRTTWAADEFAARPYFTEPYADSVTREADFPESVFRAAGELWSTTGDLCRWGSFLCDPDPGILAPGTVEEMHAVQIMVDNERWTSGWGLGVSLNRQGERVFGGHAGGMPGFLAGLAYARKEKVVAAALANGYADAHQLALELAAKAAEAFPPEAEAWSPEDPPPAELAALLGRWWSEGSESVITYRHGRLEARRVDDPPDKEPSVFEELAPDLYRTVSGRERGELLRVVRDESGAAVKLYWASYPFTRTPEPFGAALTRE